MPNTTQVKARVQNYELALAVLPTLQVIHKQAKAILIAKELYASGANPDFNAALHAIFTPAERVEVEAMISDLAALAERWSTQHAALLSVAAE